MFIHFSSRCLHVFNNNNKIIIIIYSTNKIKTFKPHYSFILLNKACFAPKPSLNTWW